MRVVVVCRQPEARSSASKRDKTQSPVRASRQPTTAKAGGRSTTCPIGACEKLRNVLPGDAVVEAIEAEAGHRAALSLAPFPKKDDPLPARSTPSRFGDGRTDGLGLIMVLMADGRLYASNSQAGGRHFPAPARLNHELPNVAAFAATDCYTPGDRPNTVSMDYLWMEGDERGAPMGPTLHAETWDMPLPEPVVEVSRDGDRVRLRVVQDGFFYEGGTTVALAAASATPHSSSTAAARATAVSSRARSARSPSRSASVAST